MDGLDSENPYAVALDIAATPVQQSYARNIRAICKLYVFGGSVAMVLALSLFFHGELIFGTLLCVIGLVGIVPAMGVLRERSWGVRACQVVSVFYLLWIPLGTILGYYFLKHIGKVRHMFR